MLTEQSIIEIEELLQKVVNREHVEPEKKKIDKGRNYLRCACPKCGDSEIKASKKRGNIFFDSGYYHCYNCNWRTPILKFFKFFHEELSDVKTRINIRQTVDAYLEDAMVKSVDQISQEKIDTLKQYAIRKDELMAKMGLLPLFPNHEYVQKKHLFHRLDHMAFKRGNIVFFNMLDDEHLLGFQIRTFNPKYVSQMKYIKYPINKIYDQFFPDRKPKDAAFQALDKISLLYNLLTVDFNKPVTVFEGASDSWLYPNSIGKSSVGLSDEFLDEIKGIRYFFDNDQAGFKKMSEKVKKGKLVFMWQKFLDDQKLWDYVDDLKDWADIIAMSKKLNRPLFREADKYFTNQSLDLIYV